MPSFNPILPATFQNISLWSDTTRAQTLTDEDKHLIEAGGLPGRKRYFEIFYGRSFLKLDRSFHASVREYCTRIINRDFNGAEVAALGSFLSLIYPDAPEMIETEFIDLELAELLEHPQVAAFVDIHKLR